MSNWTRKSALRGALVITRKQGEKVVINNGELVVEVVQVKGKTARLAFVASKDISIQRQEAIPQEIGHEDPTTQPG